MRVDTITMILGEGMKVKIQVEIDLAWDKEIQSWIDAKDCAKEALDQNFGSAIEKGGEGIIHHWKSLYHGGKAIGMELKNKSEEWASPKNNNKGDLCDMRDNDSTPYGDGLCDMRD